MLKTIHKLRIISILLLASSFCLAQEIRTVVAEGVGNSPQSAAQDAAQNALTNVVGSFIDADKQLEKRTEIRDGIRSQTTQIRTDIKEYSQGCIQSLELVDTRQDGSFFRVTAKVGVRIAEFRAYVKKLAEGEVSVGSGLFAEMTTTQKQSQSLARMLSERILTVVNGEVVKFAVGKPVPYRRSRFAATGALSLGGPDELAVFEVTASLDEAFLGNLIQTLDSVAASKKRVSTASAPYNFWWTYSQNGDCKDVDSSAGASGQSLSPAGRRVGALLRLPVGLGGGQLRKSNTAANPDAAGDSNSGSQQADSMFCLPVIDNTPNTATVYRFSNVDHELSEILNWRMGAGSFDISGDLARGTIKLPTLEVAVLDNNKKELQVELVSANGSGGGRVALDTQYPWLLYSPVGRSAGAVLVRQRTFSVVMKIDGEALRQADSIRIKLLK